MNGAEILTRVRRFVIEDLWHLDLRPGSLTAGVLRLLQLTVMISRGFVRDQLLLRASALTYVTVLSLIPLLAVMVAFVRMVNADQSLVNMVVDQLTVVAPDARQAILERVREAKLGSLGTIGATALVLTTVLALRHLEETLNGIWGVRRSRSWMRRFADYLAVLVVAPILTAIALSLATTLQSEPTINWLLEYPLFASLYDTGLAQLPQIFLLVAFTFLYWFFPNTRVRPVSALLGGVVAAVLFSLARYVYVDFSVGAARYSVLFGSFAALPLVLVWLYICWAVLLLGAEVAFAHQNLSHYRRELRGSAPGPAEREAMALRMAVEVARAFREHEPPRTANDLADDLDVPVRTVRELLETFERARIVSLCGGDEREGGYLPARPLADISTADVLGAVRGVRRVSRRGATHGAESAATQNSVEHVLGDLDRALFGVAKERSLADIVATAGSA